MNDALAFLESLRSSLWNGLDSITFPVLGVSFLVVLLSVLFINLFLWFLRVVTGGKQDSSSSGSSSQKLDDNNNYIYRR